MGQKVNPHGLRVGVIKDWDSKWYADGDFADYLVEDYNIRTFLKKKLYAAGVSKIEIERASDRVKVIIYTAKPGVVIGKGGAEIEKIKAEVQKLTDKKLVVDIKDAVGFLSGSQFHGKTHVRHTQWDEQGLHLRFNVPCRLCTKRGQFFGLT